jgi:hypothetical protein
VWYGWSERLTIIGKCFRRLLHNFYIRILLRTLLLLDIFLQLNRTNADMIYRDIVKQLETQTPDFIEGVKRLSKDFNKLNQVYYSDSINLSNIDEIRIELASQ